LKRIVAETAVMLSLAVIMSLSPYYSWLFVLMSIYSLLTLSWLFMRKAGRISMGHSFLFGFPVFLASAGYSFSSEVSIQLFIAGCALSFVIFYIFAEMTGRTAFVFLTLVFSIFVWVSSPKLVFEKGGYLTGGEVGFSFPTISQKELHILTGGTLTLFYLIYRIIGESRAGYFMRAVGDDETASKAVGIDLRKIKALSILLSGMTAWSAGIIYGLEFGHISPEIFSVEISVFPFIASLIGAGNPFASVLSSFGLVYLSKILNSMYPGLMGIVYAAILILSPKIGWWVYVKGKRLDEKAG